MDPKPVPLWNAVSEPRPGPMRGHEHRVLSVGRPRYGGRMAFRFVIEPMYPASVRRWPS